MIDVKELKILNRTDCQCGTHEFTLKDVKSVEQLTDAHGFYGNLVKHYSKVICPICKKETILLLKQKGQTWEIMNTAVTNNNDVIEFPNYGDEEDNYAKQDANIEENASNEIQDADIHTTEQSEAQNEEENNQSQEFICPECKKVCKNKSGLAAHMRTHQN